MRKQILVLAMLLVLPTYGQQSKESNTSHTGMPRNESESEKSASSVEECVTQPSVSKVREGVFVFGVPPGFSRIPLEVLKRLKPQMVQGARELAIMSKSADPSLFKEEFISFFAGYQSEGGRVQIIMLGHELPVSASRDDMFRANAERIEWGRNTGQLLEGSGASKLSIGSVPALLMDIVSSQGERLQTYTFFHSDYPKHSFAIAIKANEAEYGAYAQAIEAFMDSVKLDFGPNGT